MCNEKKLFEGAVTSNVVQRRVRLDGNISRRLQELVFHVSVCFATCWRYHVEQRIWVTFQAFLLAMTDDRSF